MNRLENEKGSGIAQGRTQFQSKAICISNEIRYPQTETSAQGEAYIVVYTSVGRKDNLLVTGCYLRTDVHSLR